MGIEWQKVESSNIEAVAYDKDKRELYVCFKSLAEYVYYDVSAEVYKAFLAADSKGRYLNENIKGVYEYARA